MAGHLQDRIRSHVLANKSHVQRVAYLDAFKIARTPAFNREGKTLTESQMKQLEALLREHGEVLEPMIAQQDEQHTEALVTAAARGEYRSIPCAPTPVFDAAAINAASAQQAADIKQALVELGSILGPKKNWNYMVIGTNEPDGVPRQNIVYVTRGGAPQLFALADSANQRIDARSRALQQFFAGL